MRILERTLPRPAVCLGFVTGVGVAIYLSRKLISGKGLPNYLTVSDEAQLVENTPPHPEPVEG